ncbi:putative rna recognition domain-containing protein 2 protein [Botrytis fragariae]|uniref:Putative rna recognition domain-containing protein 2 protein n=1 Tax=Botrytis fragariae TaxID=1964551 RepID=A0A8H6B575_9HELO|nr:putative rna recognition domain-containing protein 2 protein [Botrytis fragariae]KAF5879639.1 putative rna recognition domain-containing protein 2 protein [Botrytis fragariae]
MSSFNRSYGQSPPSPVSNGAFESIQGTPNTAITAISPEDARVPKQSATDSRASSVTTTVNQHDPFVTTGTTTSRASAQLSATASAFQPLHLYGPAVGAPITGNLIANGSGSTTLIPGTIQYLDNVVASQSPVRESEVTSYGKFSTDTGATRCIRVTDIYQKADVNSCVQYSFEKLNKAGVIITGGKRIEVTKNNVVYIRMSNIYEAAKVYTAIKIDHVDCAVEYIKANDFGGAISPQSRTVYSAHEGQVMLTATYPPHTNIDKKVFEESLRDLLSVEGELYAWQKFLATEAGTFRLCAEFVDSAMVARAIERCNNKLIGNILVKCEMHTPDVAKNRGTSRNNLAQAITPTRRSAPQADISDVLGHMSLQAPQTPGFPNNAAMFNSGSPNPQGIQYMTTNHYGMLPSTTVPYVMSGMGGMYTGQPLAFQTGFPAALATNRPSQVMEPYESFAPQAYSPHMYASHLAQQGVQRYPTSPQAYSNNFGYMSPQTPNSREVARSGNRRQLPVARTPQGQLRGRGTSNPAASHHNHVDINKINAGLDVRTTVMLRNIPNKVDQAMLKSIVDESSFGRYDFMYLRIDFSNDCNVGYAFINFVDPMDIIEFVLARSNQKWHRFKSDKVAEVSYATIQGRDCLIQKFRNSSVMLEPPHYRPKLFLTHSDGANVAGLEDEFPPSDNASKLKRSCENAEHVGLFAPSAGQYLRDEQRRRRSQYDRGTSLAEREEYGFDDDEDDLHRSPCAQGFSPHY